MSARRISTRQMTMAASLAIFIWGSIDSLWGAILPDLAARAHLSSTQAGNISLLNGVGLVIASLVAGPMLDRFGKKSVFLPALFLIGVALAGLTHAMSALSMGGWALVMGLGGSGVVTAAQALVSDLHGGRRTAALNLLNFFFGFGAFVTPLARTPMEHRGGANGILWILAAVCAFVFLLDLSLPFPAASLKTELPSEMSGGRRREFWILAGIIFLYVGVETSIWFWQEVYWASRFNVNASQARLGVSLFAVALMVGRLLSPWFLRRWSSRALLVWGTSGSLAGVICMFGSQLFTASMIALSVAGIFMAVVYPTSLGWIGTRFADASGTPLGLAVTAGWLGAMSVRPSIGYLARGHTLIGGYRYLLIAVVLMCLMNGWLLRSSAPVPSTVSAVSG